MTLEHVTTYEEAYTVALIRNECREWMTLDGNVLDVKRQKEFYEQLPREDMILFIAREDIEPVGYGVLRIEENRGCLTGGLAEPYRGKGLGRELFRQLIHSALRRNLHPWLEVLNMNARAIGLYNSLGFVQVAKDDRLTLMHYKP
jgi:ribosomal protein S18 acetylase RimI-like enzyme